MACGYVKSSSEEVDVTFSFGVGAEKVFAALAVPTEPASLLIQKPGSPPSSQYMESTSLAR